MNSRAANRADSAGLSADSSRNTLRMRRWRAGVSPGMLRAGASSSAIAAAARTLARDRLIADVAPELHAVIVDAIDQRVGLALRVADPIAQAHGAQHTPAAGHDPARC